LYFVVASLWGFGVGVLGAAVALRRGMGLNPTPVATLLLLGAAVAAVGGAVTAGVYRGARKRLA
jgi:hypothetical protein